MKERPFEIPPRRGADRLSITVLEGLPASSLLFEDNHHPVRAAFTPLVGHPFEVRNILRPLAEKKGLDLKVTVPEEDMVLKMTGEP